MGLIEFFVPGLPKPAGSKRPFQTKSGKLVVVDASGEPGKHWRADCKHMARLVYQGPILDCALSLDLFFVFPRPKGHYGTGKNAGKVKSGAPEYPMGRPDTTKLIRAVEDSLTGVLYRDDASIVTQTAAKRYGDNPGVHVRLTEQEGSDGEAGRAAAA